MTSHVNEEVLRGPTLTWKAGMAEPQNTEEAAEAQRWPRAEERYPEPHEAVGQPRDQNTPDEEP